MEYYNSILRTLTVWQHNLNQYLSQTIRSIGDDNSLATSLIVIGIAFLYGLIHAAGPGHGKVLVAIYFTDGKKRDYKSALQMGYLISIIHTISALIVTFVLFFVIKNMFYQKFHNTYEEIVHITSILIMAVGVYIIYEAFRNRKFQENNNNIDKSKSKFAIALSVGAVPCPGVMTIVLFSIVLKHYMLAIFSAVAMSIGMGITISVVGILSVMFSKKIEHFTYKKGYILQILSGVLIVLLGIFLFTS